MNLVSRFAFITAFCSAAASSSLALEAVVQSDVGSGSAVAGSIGAVNARADALQGNLNAANLLIQQLQQQIATLQKQVSNTERILDQVVKVTQGGTPGATGLTGAGGLAGYNGTDAVSVHPSVACAAGDVLSSDGNTLRCVTPQMPCTGATGTFYFNGGNFTANCGLVTGAANSF